MTASTLLEKSAEVLFLLKPHRKETGVAAGSKQRRIILFRLKR